MEYIVPYIKQEDRERLISQQSIPRTPGELNYTITSYIIDYIRLHKLSYQTINDIIGALEGAKLEFYRRIAVPYENKKIKDNGDVY